MSETAAGELLAVDERLAGDLPLDFPEELPAAVEVVGVGEVAAQIDVAAVRVVAFVGVVLLVAAPTPRRLKLSEALSSVKPLSRHPCGGVVGAERIVFDGGGDDVVADDDVLLDVLVVDAEGDVLIELGGRRQVEQRAQADDVAVAGDRTTAEGGDVAVLLGAGEPSGSGRRETRAR